MATQEVWTIGKILKWTEEYFKKAGLDTPRLDAEVLLSHVMKKARIYLYVHFDEPMMAPELAAYKACIKKRAARMPVAYITGHREFMSIDLKVTRDTLIPRPDTEILVEAVADRLRRLKAAREADVKDEANVSPEADNGDGTAVVQPIVQEIADIGTGSGAICLSLLNYIKNLRAATVDISASAIAVARENAEALGLRGRVEFLQGDMLQPLQGRLFDAIVSNPPYIPSGDIDGLERDVKSYEPINALDGGADGLDFYRKLVNGGGALLKAGGFLAVEIGINQAEALRQLADKKGGWGELEIIKDIAGIDRVVILWKQK